MTTLYVAVGGTLGVLARYGITMAPIDDTMLMSYALDGPQYNGLDVLAKHWLDHQTITFSQLAGISSTSSFVPSIQVTRP